MNEDKDIKMAVPKLRFPEFVSKNKWVSRQLKDVATLFKGKGIAKSDIVENGILQCIRYGELYTCYGEVINNVISSTNISSDNLILSRSNDVIIPSSGETAIDIATASCVLKDGIALGGDLNIIRSDENGVFLSYYLNNVKKREISQLAQGIVVVHLYIDQLKTLNIQLPSVQEQNLIADCLTSLDNAISAVNDKIEALKEYKKGLMQQLFPAEGKSVPAVRFPEFQNDGEWIDNHLGSICDYANGSSCENLVKQGGAYFLISLNSIDIEGNLKREMKRVEYTDNSLKKDDIIMVLSDVAHGNFLGLAAIIPNEHYVLNQRMARLRLKEKFADTVDISFLRLYINSCQKYFKNKGQGSSQLNLSKLAVTEFPLYIPREIAEQQEIANCLSSIDNLILAESENHKKLTNHKAGLMQQLFPNLNE